VSTDLGRSGPTGDVADQDFVRVCRLDELPDVGVAAADINGTIVAIARDENGHVHAVNDTCSHANVSLSEGELDGCTLECWLHGSRFDMVTGEPSGPPATIPIDVYPVKIEGDEVFVAVPSETKMENRAR
jgi:3-phenylpropionate/trans-cinnamate dioxygenase ferredoxin subunit